MEWVVKSQQELGMMLLDYKKAIDRINWTFLQAIMQKMEFEETFIR